MKIQVCMECIMGALIEWIVTVVSCLVMSNSFATPWIVAHQGPLFKGFPRQ